MWTPVVEVEACVISAVVSNTYVVGQTFVSEYYKIMLGVDSFSKTVCFIKCFQEIWSTCVIMNFPTREEKREKQSREDKTKHKTTKCKNTVQKKKQALFFPLLTTLVYFFQVVANN